METKKKSKKIILILIPVLVLSAFLLSTTRKEEKAEAGTLNNLIQNEGNGSTISNPLPPSADADSNQNGSDKALAQAVVTNSKDNIMEHRFIAENGNYELYLLDSTLSVIIRDKTTGAIMESTVRDDDGKSNAAWKNFMQSGINLELQEDVTTQQKKIDLLSAAVTVTIEEHGFHADVNYEKYGISLRIIVGLNEDGSLTVEVPEEFIEEKNEKQKIGSIYVYPFLGYTYLGEREGYMFVPDGNGALIYLDDKEGRFSSAYSQKVYGNDIGVEESYVLSLFWDSFPMVNDSEKILAPIYGMVHTDSKLGYLAIIESGAEYATIEAYPNGAYTSYNWITSKFKLCNLYVQPTSKSGGSVTKVTDRMKYDIKIKFAFVNETEANYTGLASRYREYLFTNNMISKTEDKFRIRLDFLGAERENWLFFKKAVNMTTIEQIQKMYKELQDEGVTDILSIYKGWQDGGINDVPIVDYKADSSVGGTKKLTNLIKEAEEKGIQFYLYADALRANPDTSNTTFNVVKKLDRRLFTERTYKLVYDNIAYVTPSRTVESVNSLVAGMQKKNAANLMLSGISNTIFTYTYSGKEYTRIETAEVYKNLIAEADSKINLLLEQPFSFLWKYTNSIIDMPVSNSNYIFTDQDIPFLSIVLKGVLPMYSDYTNFEANKQEYFLKLVETGIYPSFYLTYEDSSDLINTNSSDIFSSKFSIYKPEIISYYNELKEVNEKVAGSYIVSHDAVKNGLTTISYDNGVEIYVNYGKSAASVDGLTIEPMSYKVGDAR